LELRRAAFVSVLCSVGSQPTLADTSLQIINAAICAFDFPKSGRVKPEPAAHEPD
jgi:hypothetical protein